MIRFRCWSGWLSCLLSGGPFCEWQKFNRASVSRKLVSVMASNVRLNDGIRHHQAGRLVEAERVYRQILRERPDDAEALHAFGVLEGQQGKTDEAIELIRRTVQLKPGLASAWRNLGAYLSEKGKFREAAMASQEALQINRLDGDPHREPAKQFASNEYLQEAMTTFREAIRLKPDLAEAHNDLANLLAIHNRTEEAIAAHSRAIALAPNYAEAHYGLGNLLSRKGQMEDALAELEKAAKLKPRFAEAHMNMGNVLRQLGRTDKAVAAYRRAIAVRPNFAVAYLNMGQALSAAGRLEEAMAAFAEAIRVKPDYLKAHLRMAIAMAKRKRFGEAREAQARAAALAPGSASVFETLGAILVLEQRAEEAEPYLRRALEIDPNLEAAWHGLGNALQALGRFDESSACFRRSMELSPDYAAGFGYRNLSYSGPVKVDEAEIQKLGAMLDGTDSPADNRVAAGFGLGRILDDAGRYDEAFAALEKANALCKKIRATGGQVYDPEAERRMNDHTIATFDRSYIEKREGWGERSELPVFVVGMPRSGTTLIHQIAAQHPQVHGAGERSDILQIGHSLKSLDDREAVSSAARRYLESIRGLSSTASRVVDKMPTNIKVLGLISVLFPDAPVILCRRDARDTCLSCYFQWFSAGNTFAYDLAHCGIEHNETDRLAKHWLTVSPLKILEVHYEKLVADLEGGSRRIIDFLGLPWDPACLEFYRAETTVLTASVWQVRQPIYQSSVGRWRHYERHLGPLMEVLGKLKAEEGI
jgi:tetratricopeptide (TPR) repeat protein